MNVKRILIFLLILSFSWGCNINLFSPFHNADNDTSLQSLLADGNAALENNKYEDAMKYFQKAMDRYPTSGKARIGYSAAYVGFKNLDMLKLINILSDDTTSDTDPLFSGSDLPFYKDVSGVVQETLLPIYKGKCDMSKNDGEANSDLAFTSILLGSLVVFDANQNGSFNDNCDILYLGHDMNVYGFDKFPSLSSADRDSIVNNINTDLDRVIYYINISTTAINRAVNVMDLDTDKPDLLTNVNDIAGTVAHQINYYRYKDGIDNDGDGLIDEEIINGIDDDGDGMVDEDSGGHI